MSKKAKLTGYVMAMAAASAFTVAPMIATADDATNMVSCYGVNSCKGKSSCNTPTTSCNGQNSCKGKGVLLMSKKACEKAGGTVMQ